jgi:predicted cupin superfamily sugar epimerase
MTSEFIIRHFQLEPLPVEGGMFRRHYESGESIPHHALPPRYTRAKLHASAICYMHTPGTRSLLHRLKTDEIYHFYSGHPAALVLLYPDGEHRVIILGHDYPAGQVPFCVVPGGVWQGSRLVEGGEWALMGATLAPAYDEDDFELGEREELLARYPQAGAWIIELT